MAFTGASALVRPLLAAGCACLLLTGCGGGTAGRPASARPVTAPPSGAPATPSPSGSTPAYSGPALPGLAAHPIALVKAPLAGVPYPVGDSFVTIDFTLAATGTGSSNPGQLTFYSAATGRQIATAQVPFYGTAQVGDFNGTPAIFVHGTEVTASDGLSTAGSVEHEVGFDASGHKVTDLSWPTSEARTGLAGWSATTAKSPGAPQLVIYDQDGSARLTLPADQTGYVPLEPELLDIVDGVALVDHSRPSAGGSGTDHYLAAYDLTHPGDPLWTSDSARPAGITSATPRLCFTSGATIGLLWPAGGGKDVLAVQDVHTGAVKGATPLIAPSSTLDGTPPEADNVQSDEAVLAFAEGNPASSVAVSLTDGHVIWQQSAGQQAFTPMVVVGGVAYGSSPSSPTRSSGVYTRASLAVDLHTGRVAADNLPTAPLSATDNGYALVPDEPSDRPDDGDPIGYWIFKAAAHG